MERSVVNVERSDVSVFRPESVSEVSNIIRFDSSFVSSERSEAVVPFKAPNLASIELPSSPSSSTIAEAISPIAVAISSIALAIKDIDGAIYPSIEGTEILCSLGIMVDRLESYPVVL